jgi:hypothetical protein
MRPSSSFSPDASGPCKVVFAPDLVGRAMFEANAAGVFQLWRQGRLRPVVNRALLARYLRVLRVLGLAEPLLRRWGWWFTAAPWALYTAGGPDESLPLLDLCLEAARQNAAQYIVHGGLIIPSPGAPPWLAAADFLRLGIGATAHRSQSSVPPD